MTMFWCVLVEPFLCQCCFQGAPVVVGYDPAATTPNVSSSAPQAYGGFTYNNEASTAPPPSYGEAAKF